MELSPLIIDDEIEITLRPKNLSEFIGQTDLKNRLGIFIAAARKRKESMDHVLLSGPPGLGKTTLAHIISNELGIHLTPTSGPALERAGDLAAILTNLNEGDCLFIDEIHRLPRIVEEILYSAMEDFKLDLVVGQGPAAKTLQIDLPHFTLIGATTRTGLLTSPLRDRFGIACRLDFYAPEELQQIIRRSSKLLSVPLQADAAIEIGSRARGTPRIANRLLKRIRDFAQVKGNGTIDLATARQGLTLLDVDTQGLDAMDRRILLTLIEKFDGGPVGIESLCSILNEEKETLEDVYEPYLIQQGFLNRTLRGRLATKQAYHHCGKTPKTSGELF